MIRALLCATAVCLATPALAQSHGAESHQHRHADFTSDRLHVRVDGEGGPGVRDIILIPGLSSSPRVWQGTVEHLGAGWRVELYRGPVAVADAHHRRRHSGG